MITPLFLYLFLHWSITNLTFTYSAQILWVLILIFITPSCLWCLIFIELIQTCLSLFTRIRYPYSRLVLLVWEFLQKGISVSIPVYLYFTVPFNQNLTGISSMSSKSLSKCKLSFEMSSNLHLIYPSQHPPLLER